MWHHGVTAAQIAAWNYTVNFKQTHITCMHHITSLPRISLSSVWIQGGGGVRRYHILNSDVFNNRVFCLCYKLTNLAVESPEQSGALQLAKSEGRFAVSAKWWMEACYLLTVHRNVDTRGMDENSMRFNFSYAWTHGLLSVRMQVVYYDCTIYRTKRLIEAVIYKASISHKIHVIWCLQSLALKKDVNCGFFYDTTHCILILYSWIIAEKDVNFFQPIYISNRFGNI